MRKMELLILVISAMAMLSLLPSEGGVISHLNQTNFSKVILIDPGPVGFKLK